ncbi:Sas10/Utp3/C1D family-domain-containing protein [Cristinia sonorae]|uniref:Exosome complex protein n=1 Tax=Cristinia sonorae TaxID=1940300 RepID=A0A8K0UTM8_9AGAR|nr:Sas10/Utp3/C1D family-domain-containing protein [Cristinia sonorae]
MAEAKIRNKLKTLNDSLDELEEILEPLSDQTLPEILAGLEPLQQAKLQVDIPYVVYDLIFIYLKTRGIDPKTHPVIGELDRVRQYFEKIKKAEDEPDNRKSRLDQAAANRFIKHAIAQVELQLPLDDPVGGPSNVRVPAKVTSKMEARAQYEQDLKALGDEEESELEVFDDQGPSGAAKGKDVESESGAGSSVGKKRRRGNGESAGSDRPSAASSAKKGRKKTKVQS